MVSEIRDLHEAYLRWLRDRSALRTVGDWVEITTPYLDRHNDYIQIYARREDHGYLLTDDGETIRDLESSGCRLDTGKRATLLQAAAAGFGVKIHERRLEIATSKENFPLKKHSLVQAMLAVNDLFVLSSPSVRSFFLEDVQAWLDISEVRYSPHVKFTGKTGFDHQFDFLIPKSKVSPERLVRVLARPNRDTAQSAAFSWVDTKEARPPNSSAYAILNDSDTPPAPSVIEALSNYDVRPVLWSDRESARADLAA